jgi:hypothetical protein
MADYRDAMEGTMEILPALLAELA